MVEHLQPGDGVVALVAPDIHDDLAFNGRCLVQRPPPFLGEDNEHPKKETNTAKTQKQHVLLLFGVWQRMSSPQTIEGPFPDSSTISSIFAIRPSLACLPCLQKSHHPVDGSAGLTQTKVPSGRIGRYHLPHCRGLHFPTVLSLRVPLCQAGINCVLK